MIGLPTGLSSGRLTYNYDQRALLLAKTTIRIILALRFPTSALK